MRVKLRAVRDLFTSGSVEFAFDGLCRLSVSHVWDDRKPLAAWLQCNPSTMNADELDHTGRRMRHFSIAVGAGGFVGVNVWPWITPYPVDLWPAIKDGRVTNAMMAENDHAIAEAAARASIWFVATGVEAPRRHRAYFLRALSAFAGSGHSLLCLGTSPDGWPLHPLARGKQAIPNTRVPFEWTPPI